MDFTAGYALNCLHSPRSRQPLLKQDELQISAKQPGAPNQKRTRVRRAFIGNGNTLASTQPTDEHWRPTRAGTQEVPAGSGLIRETGRRAGRRRRRYGDNALVIALPAALLIKLSLTTQKSEVAATRKDYRITLRVRTRGVY